MGGERVDSWQSAVGFWTVTSFMMFFLWSVAL